MDDTSVGPWGFDLTRLRRGEITAVIAAVFLLLSLLALPWYVAHDPHLIPGPATGPGGTAPGEFGAWSGQGTLGTLGNLVILAAALWAIAVTVAGSRGIELDGSGLSLFWLSVAATAVIVLRMIFQPSVISGYEFSSSLRFGIFITLVCALVLVWAAWMRRSRPGPQRPVEETPT